eukprot:gene5151-5391_t
MGLSSFLILLFVVLHATAAPSRQVTEGTTKFRVFNPPRKNVCTDVPPDDRFTCAQQMAWGKCTHPFMVKGNYCAKTCGRAPCPAVATDAASPISPSPASQGTWPPSPSPSPEEAATSAETPPPSPAPSMMSSPLPASSSDTAPSYLVTEGGVTFRRYKRPSIASCTDVPPDDRYTCAQQAAWGKEGIMDDMDHAYWLEVQAALKSRLGAGHDPRQPDCNMLQDILGTLDNVLTAPAAARPAGSRDGNSPQLEYVLDRTGMQPGGAALQDDAASLM